MLKATQSKRDKDPGLLALNPAKKIMDEDKQAGETLSFAKGVLRRMVVGRMSCNLLSIKPVAALTISDEKQNGRAINHQLETMPGKLPIPHQPPGRRTSQLHSHSAII